MIQIRNRPYMVIRHRMVPSKLNPSVTETIEEMVISDRISNNQLDSATIIIDILNAKIIKNRDLIGSQEDLVSKYIDRYNVDVQGALSDWARQSPENAAAIAAIFQILTESEEAEKANENNSAADTENNENN